MVMWYYIDKQINEIVDLPKGAFGFIYQTTHLPTGKKYIGKKSLIYNLKKKLGKKEKALWEGKGRPPVYKQVQKESDWKTYYGSHSFIKEANKEDLERKILVSEVQDPVMPPGAITCRGAYKMHSL